MKKWWIVGLLVVVAGCGDTTPSASTEPGIPPAKPSTSPVTEEPKPNPADGQSSPQVKKPGFNEARVHQTADLKLTKVTVGKHTFDSWVMDDDGKRSEGMMFLTKAEVPVNRGMLFVFPDEAPRSFWMHNTLIDLDIAYISKSGSVVSVHEMKALDETGVPSKGPAMYALEVLGGTFKRLKIVAGMKVTLSPPVRSKD